MSQPQILVTHSRIGARDVFALAVAVDAEPALIDVTPRDQADFDPSRPGPVIVPFDLSRLSFRAAGLSEGPSHDPFDDDAQALLAFARYLAEGLFAATAPTSVEDDVIEGLAA